MKWLRIILAALVPVLLLLAPLPVFADSTATVTITAVGYIVEAPGGFTLTYVSDYEVEISWTKGTDAENTMVRAAVGRMPTSRTDGYLIYYGNGTSATDWSNNLDTLDAAVYYRAWSQNAEGLWEEIGSSSFVAGVGVTALIIGIICLGLMIAGYVIKNPWLLFSSGLGWILFGFIMYSKVFENPFLNQGLLILGFALAILCFISTIPIFTGMRPTRISPEERDYQEYRRKVIDVTRRGG